MHFVVIRCKRRRIMEKVVILGGNARSGKSTLAYKLQRNGFNRISFDDLYDSIEEGLGFKVDELDKDIQNRFFESIVDKAVLDAEMNHINTVIDMFDFLPEDIYKLKQKDKVEVYFLAYPNCPLEQIKYNVVHYAKPTDWIAQVDEEYLDICVKRFEERNKLLVRECEKYKLPLIDTMDGENREKVLEDLFKRIINK